MTTVLVVGGTSGLGLAVARKYVADGWSVVITGRDAGRAEEVAADVGGGTRGLAVDLSEPETVAAALEPIEAVDHIVLSAIDRDTNNIAGYDIAAARYLAMLKLVGYTAVISTL